MIGVLIFQVKQSFSELFKKKKNLFYFPLQTIYSDGHSVLKEKLTSEAYVVLFDNEIDRASLSILKLSEDSTADRFSYREDFKSQSIHFFSFTALKKRRNSELYFFFSFCKCFPNIPF